MIESKFSTANKLMMAVSLSPAVWLAGVFFFFVRARIHLGFWPAAYVPDPKSLPFEFHHWIFMVGVFPLAASIPCVLVFALAQYWRSGRIASRELVAYLGGWIAVFGIMAIPGVDFITWFLD